jgi:hypothetical protein
MLFTLASQLSRHTKEYLSHLKSRADSTLIPKVGDVKCRGYNLNVPRYWHHRAGAHAPETRHEKQIVATEKLAFNAYMHSGQRDVRFLFTSQLITLLLNDSLWQHQGNIKSDFANPVVIWLAWHLFYTKTGKAFCVGQQIKEYYGTWGSKHNRIPFIHFMPQLALFICINFVWPSFLSVFSRLIISVF